MIWIVNHSDHPIECPSAPRLALCSGYIEPGTEHVHSGSIDHIRDVPAPEVM